MRQCLVFFGRSLQCQCFVKVCVKAVVKLSNRKLSQAAICCIITFKKKKKEQIIYSDIIYKSNRTNLFYGCSKLFESLFSSLFPEKKISKKNKYKMRKLGRLLNVNRTKRFSNDNIKNSSFSKICFYRFQTVYETTEMTLMLT